MKIKTEDKIVQQVLRKMDERSLIGQKKYGATMMQEIVGEEKDLNRFLIDVQEELMDALLYIEAAKRCLSDEIEQAMINRNNIIGQNGNDGLHYTPQPGPLDGKMFTQQQFDEVAEKVDEEYGHTKEYYDTERNKAPKKCVYDKGLSDRSQFLRTMKQKHGQSVMTTSEMMQEELEPLPINTFK